MEKILIEKSKDYKFVQRISEKTLNIVKSFEIDQPSINSFIDYRIILKNKSTVQANVLLKLTNQAINANVFLSIKCLILNNSTKANIVPSLEIECTDVKAGHAATISYLNQEELSYLLSRGLNLKEAEEMLIKSFSNS